MCDDRRQRIESWKWVEDHIYVRACISESPFSLPLSIQREETTLNVEWIVKDYS
jgi:hypothetical protein